MKLDEWQIEVLQTQGNICLRSGRQVGKSTVISIKAGDYALLNNKKTIMVIASVERQAALLFEKILAYIYETDKQAIKKGKDRPTKHKLQLKNGSVIHCLPTGESGYGIRGYTIDLLIADEAAFIPEAVWSAVTPMMATTKGDTILLSTPYGREGYFARCFNDDAYTKFHISSEECGRIDKDFLVHEKQTMTKLQYSQEYLGEFVDELMQFFSDKLIIGCQLLKREKTGKDYYLGVDVARFGGDETTFEIIDRTDKDNLKHVESIATTKNTITETAREIIQLNREYKFKKIYIDDGGLGVGVFDTLMENSETKRITIPVNNASRALDNDYNHPKKKKLLKEDLYNNLKNLMEQRKIKLLDDPEVFQSLKSVQFEYTEKGNLRIYGRYTHIVEGLIRAVYCYKDISLSPCII